MSSSDHLRRAVSAAAALLAVLVNARPSRAQPAPSGEEPIDVTVEGDRAKPGATSFGRREIREMPGVLGDPYRAIEAGPGVVPVASGLPYFYIRGAPPGNIGYSFDGIPVPLLFHVGAGPSVVPPALIQRVELHPGPYPIEHGRIAGALVDAESRPPSTSWRGEGAFRFSEVGALVEGPLRDDLHLLVGGRYSIGSRLITALVPSISFDYADYQVRAVKRLSRRETLGVLAFGSRDFLAAASSGRSLRDRDGDGEIDRDVLLDTVFHRAELRYERQLDLGRKLTASMLVGYEHSRDVGLDFASDVKVSAKTSYTHPIRPLRAVLRMGAVATIDSYRVEQRAEPPCSGEDCAFDLFGTAQTDFASTFPELFKSRVDLALGAWTELAVAVSPRALVIPGLRVDHYASLGNTALGVDPRLVSRFYVGRFRLSPAVGMASQPPSLVPLPALQTAGLPGGLQRALQSSFEVQYAAGPVTLDATAFRQVTFGLTDPVGTNRGAGLDAQRFLSRSTGDAYGVELAARGALRRDMFFLLAYTLSRSTRTRNGLTLLSAVDRTHVIQAALLFDLGRQWRLGFRHVFYTGFPAQEVGRPGGLEAAPPRTPPFYRVDARLSKRWKIGDTGFWGVVFDLQNATLSREVFDVTCGLDGCQPRFIGPITIPTLAIEGGF